MSQNYGPFPAVCGQTPASVLITGLGPKCIRYVLKENESAKYFNRRNMLLLVVKQENPLKMEISSCFTLKSQQCSYGNVSGNSYKISDKTEKKNPKQLKLMS